MVGLLPGSNRTLLLTYGGCSLQGRRDENQDAFLVKYPSSRTELDFKGSIACIADGVSCSDQGQKASHTSVMQFSNDYYATPDSWGVKRSVTKVLTALNTWLFTQSERDHSHVHSRLIQSNQLSRTSQSTQNGEPNSNLPHNGLVTTFSSIVFKSNTAHIFHVGDSRIYRFRGGELTLLTRDHQRMSFGTSGYLTRALGIDNRLDVDYQSLSLEVGDLFLLTTDGVHDYLPQDQIAALLEKGVHNPEETAQILCQEALNSNSQDNATSLIVSVTELPMKSALDIHKKTLDCAIPPALKVNNTIDGFKVINILNESSRSYVYEVIEEGSDERFILKALPPSYIDDQAALTNFSHEYWIGSQMNSERIMRVYPKPEGSKFIYHLYEQIDGVTLRQWIYDNPMPSIQSVRLILAEIVKAVRVMQRLDMVHRDLKPENIMITENGRIKLIDFGSAKVMGLTEAVGLCSDEFPLGAANYIAPEYLAGEDATTVSDLFSVAVIGYEMLTGALPYKEINSQSISQARHQKWHYRSARTVRADIPLWLDLTFKKACHPSTLQRYQVMSEFIADLSIPNAQLIKEMKKSPLTTTNPLMLWKSATLVCFVIAVVEWLLLVG